ncbi:MAG: tetratricopeptide repeat protein [Vampirovibrionales bacterium]
MAIGYFYFKDWNNFKQKTIQDYDKAIKRHPHRAENYFFRGELYEKLGQYAEAIDDYTKALELDPSTDWAWEQRGDSQRKLERYAEAIDDYTKALELEPSNAWVWRHRGLAYLELGQYAEAIEDFTQAITLISTMLDSYVDSFLSSDDSFLNPEFAESYHDRGLAYLALGHTEAATADFQRTLELDPTHEKAQAQLKKLTP